MPSKAHSIHWTLQVSSSIGSIGSSKIKSGTSSMHLCSSLQWVDGAFSIATCVVVSSVMGALPKTCKGVIASSLFSQPQVPAKDVETLPTDLQAVQTSRAQPDQSAFAPSTGDIKGPCLALKPLVTRLIGTIASSNCLEVSHLRHPLSTPTG